MGDTESKGTTLTYASGNRPATATNAVADGMRGLQFLTGLAADLSKGPVELPCFPNVVIKIRDALNNPRTSADETVRLVGSDPRLAARLIQTANSAAFNPSGNRVTELRTAIARLGHQLVQGTAMAYAIQQVKNEAVMRPIAQRLAELWKESITVASICQVVARRTKVHPDEAFLAGLLHGIGRLYIMTHSVVKAAQLGDESMSNELIEGWHPPIGKAVLENWQLPEAVAAAVGDQADRERSVKQDADLTDVLIVSKVLADVQNQQHESLLSEMLAVHSFRPIGIDVKDCAIIVKHSQYQLGSLQDTLSC